MVNPLQKIFARWDAKATEQLCAEVARLAAENERLTEALSDSEYRRCQAEQCADNWRDDFMRMAEDTGAQPGITIDGHLVIATGASHG